jgi:ribosomal protein L21E
MKKGGQAKVSKVMKEFGKGKLHSGKKGPVVKSRKQAVAIALSEAGMSKKKK